MIETCLSLPARLEALLFVAPGAVTSAQLAAALEVSQKEAEEGLAALESYYLGRTLPDSPAVSGSAACAGRGLRLQWQKGRVQLTTAPQAAALVERFLGLEASSRLSRAALETLAIVAYQQPVTRPQVDAIRGVSSDGVMKSLLSKGLVQEVGRAEAPGRPILYSITPEFLQYFGLNRLEDLPPLNLDEAAPPQQEDKSKLLKD